MADQSAMVLGPLVAAAVIADLGVRAAFYVDSITFVMGALSVLPLQLGAWPRRSAKHHCRET